MERFYTASNKRIQKKEETRSSVYPTQLVVYNQTSMGSHCSERTHTHTYMVYGLQQQYWQVRMQWERKQKETTVSCGRTEGCPITCTATWLLPGRRKGLAGGRAKKPHFVPPETDCCAWKTWAEPLPAGAGAASCEPTGTGAERQEDAFPISHVPVWRNVKEQVFPLLSFPLGWREGRLCTKTRNWSCLREKTRWLGATRLQLSLRFKGDGGKFPSR